MKEILVRTQDKQATSKKDSAKSAILSCGLF